MIKSILLVGLGSFVGGSLRYAISLLMKNICPSGFPWGTLAVNLIGCFVIGMAFALFSKCNSISSNWYLFIATGICGGFTTFSAFANESMQMLQAGQLGAFISYVAISVIAGIGLAALGYAIIK